MLIDLKPKQKHTSESQLNTFWVQKSMEAMRYLNLKSSKELDLCFANFEPNASYFYLSNGKVSSYQLLNYFLDKFNEPATVFITTWGMTELAIRNLATRKQSGQIEQLFFVFSEQTKVNKANEHQLALSIATGIKTMPCHAKIYLIKTQNHCISIITSGNLNRNNKLEAGTITGNKNIYEAYASFLQSQINL